MSSRQRKPYVGRIEGGRWWWVGQGKVVHGKWNQLYLKNTKRKQKREKEREKKAGKFVIQSKVFVKNY